MTDIRTLLEHGADVHVGLPDVELAVREAASVRRRRTTLRLAVAAALVLVAGLIGTLLRPEPTPPPIVDRPTVQSAPVPSPGETLAAGTANSTAAAGLPWVVRPPVDGWTVRAVEDGWVSLHRDGERVNLQRWTAVVDPASDPVAEQDPRPVPDDLRTWLLGHPRLAVSATRQVDLGGDPWWAVDLTVRRPLRFIPSECSGNRCALVGVVGSEHVDLLASEDVRILLPTAGSDGLVIVTAVPSSAADWTDIEALLASLTKD